MLRYQLHIMFAEPIIHTLYTNTLCVMCMSTSGLERSPLMRVDFISWVRIPLVLLHLSLFKPLFTRCIPTLQLSCLDSVVVRAFDSKCLELSIPGLNPTSAFDAGGYDGITLFNSNWEKTCRYHRFLGPPQTRVKKR